MARMYFCEVLQVLETQNIFNPFHVNAQFLYRMNTPDNLWISNISRRYKNGTLEQSLEKNSCK